MHRISFLTSCVVLTATPLWAHHPLSGLPMQTGVHGLLSGIGHPILGFDHLFFVIAVGIAAALIGRAASGPLIYLVAMALGTAAGPIDYTEALIAVSLVALGGVLAHGRVTAPVLLLFAGFGLVHGMAFGAAILGQEGGAAPSVWIGYLAGLVTVQYGIARLAGLVTRLGDTVPRLVGAAVAGVGLFLCLEIVEGPLVALIAG